MTHTTLTVDVIMSRELRTLNRAHTVKQALEALSGYDIRHVPVVEEDGVTLAGLVSDRDLREYTVPTLVQVRDPGQHAALLETPLDEVMRVGLLCVEPGDSVRAAIGVMLQYRVGAVPVVEPGTKGLCGILSYVDVLKLAAERL